MSNRTNATVAAQEAQLTAMAAELAQLKQQLADSNAALAASQQTAAPRTTLPTFDGIAATALIRSLANGPLGQLSPSQIQRCLLGLGIAASPSTVTTQRQLALKGHPKHGIAPKAGPTLTEAQVARLKAALLAGPQFAPQA